MIQPILGLLLGLATSLLPVNLDGAGRQDIVFAQAMQSAQDGLPGALPDARVSTPPVSQVVGGGGNTDDADAAGPASQNSDVYVTPVSDAATVLRARNPRTNREIQLYSESHALLIGQAKYVNWDELDSVNDEIFALRDALERLHFKVEVHFDLKSEQLFSVIDSFMRRRATVEDSRIFVYVSGHGWNPSNRRGSNFGYLLGTDAAGEDNASEIPKSSLPQSMFEAWAKYPQPRHMLFVFDACFSGGFLGPRDVGDLPESSPLPDDPASSEATIGDALLPPKNEIGFPDQSDYVFRALAGNPGREFLAGALGNEKAPQDSYLANFLVDVFNGVKAGEVQSGFDSWTTGAEIGEYLQANLFQLTRDLPNPTSGIYQRVMDRDYPGTMSFPRLDFQRAGRGLVQSNTTDNEWSQLASVAKPPLSVSQFKQLRLVTEAADSMVKTFPGDVVASLQTELHNHSDEIDSQLIAVVQSLKFAKREIQRIEDEALKATRTEAQDSGFISVEKEEDLQRIIDRMSSDKMDEKSKEPVRRIARRELGKFISDLAEPAAKNVNLRLIRSLSEKSYQYQIGLAVAIKTAKKFVVEDRANAIMEVDKAVERTHDRTLKARLLEAKAFL